MRYDEGIETYIVVQRFTPFAQKLCIGRSAARAAVKHFHSHRAGNQHAVHFIAFVVRSERRLRGFAACFRAADEAFVLSVSEEAFGREAGPSLAVGREEAADDISDDSETSSSNPQASSVVSVIRKVKRSAMIFFILVLY